MSNRVGDESSMALLVSQNLRQKPASKFSGFIDDYDEKNKKPTIKEKLGNFLNKKWVTKTIEYINLTLGIINMLGYLFSTYTVWIFLTKGWGIFSYFSRVFFMTEYLLRLYTAEVRKNHLFTAKSFLLIFSSLPYLLIKMYEDPFMVNLQS